ncbi:MAG: MerR family transcriptional regulator [Myxococcota bacterium]|nr:MerR family transcriptional regulator [Myxococcota bacterium]
MVGEITGIKIGEIIRETGVTRATIHHYVREGLLPEPTKTSRNMALYDPSCVDRVLLIKGLQSQARRSLAEVKELLIDAAGHDGLQRLQKMLQVESLRSQASPLNPERSQQELTIKELSDRTGFPVSELEEFHTLGLVAIHGPKRNRCIGASDVAVADALARLAQAGFDDEAGFRPRHAVIYLDALRSLLHKEVALFLEVTSADAEPEDVLAKAELGIERVTPLLLAIRQKLIREFIQATPLLANAAKNRE